MRHYSQDWGDGLMRSIVGVSRGVDGRGADGSFADVTGHGLTAINETQAELNRATFDEGRSHKLLAASIQRRGSLLRGLVVAFGCVMMIGAARAEEKPEDKSRYSFFDPTPDRLLRDLTTDRPDTTESPFTVDAGRVQIETNLFGFSRSRPDVDGTRTDTFEFGTTNIRFGLTSSTELNLVWQPYGVVRTRQSDPVAVFRSSGIGGLDVRGKINLWGNDTFEKPGSTALALLPFITIPTDRRNGISPEFVEGGIIVPYAIKLSEKFGLGLNVGALRTKPEADAGYHTEYLASASLAYEWSGKVGTYYEIAGRFGTKDPRGDVVNLGTGITFKIDKNTQLDAGVNIGVTSAADRINPFFGLTRRF